MHNDYSLFNMDLAIPNLVPAEVMFDDLPQINDPEITSLKNEIADINARLEKITIDSNTQSLRVDVERVKRRKLQTSLKQVRNKMSNPCPDIAVLKQQMNEQQHYQNTINFQFYGELTCMSSIIFRCFARTHEMIAYILPYVMLPPDNHNELSQMLTELTQTIRQFHTYNEATYV